MNKAINLFHKFFEFVRTLFASSDKLATGHGKRLH